MVKLGVAYMYRKGKAIF